MSKKIAVVTGGASGIGKCTCELLIKNGYQLMLSDINEQLGLAVVEALKNAGGDVVFHKADVSKFQEVKTLIDKAVAHFGQLDLLVNNAGIGPKKYQKTADHTLEDWDNVVTVNQSGVFYGMKVALGYMEKQGFGNIVNVASLAGIRGSLTGVSYSASKFAVVGMTKSAALEYGKLNIRINCICPSFTETPLLNDNMTVIPGMKEKLMRTVPLRRFAGPEEMAEGILWLASDKSGFVTGHSLVIDGGVSI